MVSISNFFQSIKLLHWCTKGSGWWWMIFCFKSLILGKKNCMLFSMVSFFFFYIHKRSSCLVCVSWTAVFYLVNYVFNWVTWLKLTGINLSGLWTLMAVLAAHQTWACSSVSVSFLHWGAQNWTWCSSCSLTYAKQRGTIPSMSLLRTLTDTAHNAIGIPCCEGPWLASALLLLLWHP